ncbi:MAG: type II toxin-antitoxin system HicA family toxin [Candidatus Aenigmatarchaeota archaeon]
MSRILNKMDFRLIRIGKHMIFEHMDGRTTSIPNHPAEEIGPGLLKKIIFEDLKISREEFETYF